MANSNFICYKPPADLHNLGSHRFASALHTGAHTPSGNGPHCHQGPPISSNNHHLTTPPEVGDRPHPRIRRAWGESGVSSHIKLRSIQASSLFSSFRLVRYRKRPTLRLIHTKSQAVEGNTRIRNVFVMEGHDDCMAASSVSIPCDEHTPRAGKYHKS